MSEESVNQVEPPEASSPARTQARSYPKEAFEATASAPEAGEPSPPPDPADPLIGSLVEGRYRILSRLGEGGMGVVYVAEHVSIEKRVALKVLLPELARNAVVRERFLQEARAAAKVRQENIVDITDFGKTPSGSVFFAMEHLVGESLAGVIRSAGRIPWSRTLPILLQLCRALGAAHERGVIHRDMKPENVLLIEREGRADFVKVLDFGIAKVSLEPGEGRRLTSTGVIFGTPHYMSPEQALGQPPDRRVDVYAVGVILYEMLTGSVPFRADSYMGLLAKHISEPPRPLREAAPDAGISVEVEAFVMRALAKAKEDRFGSMAEMAEAATRVDRPAPIAIGFRTAEGLERLAPATEAVAGAPRPRGRLRGRTALALLAALAGLALLAWVLGRPVARPPGSRPAPPDPTPATVTAPPRAVPQAEPPRAAPPPEVPSLGAPGPGAAAAVARPEPSSSSSSPQRAVAPEARKRRRKDHAHRRASAPSAPHKAPEKAPADEPATEARVQDLLSPFPK
jgi:eukaryotic-like serine/threonine-protein kinase